MTCTASIASSNRNDSPLQQPEISKLAHKTTSKVSKQKKNDARIANVQICQDAVDDVRGKIHRHGTTGIQ